MSYKIENCPAWRMTQDTFIGPAMILPVFEIDGRRDESFELVWEFAEDESCLGPSVWTGMGYTISRLIDFEPEGTFVLFDHRKHACGFYMGGSCWIDPKHRAKGLSKHLILAACRFLGGCPSQNTEGLGYSQEGYEAHVRAHRYAVEMAFKAGLPVSREILNEYDLLDW